MPQGIDVSQHQGDVNWAAVAADKIDFAIVKATEGQDFKDERFNGARIRLMREAGLTVGVYHFLRPRAGRTGGVEIDFAVKTARAAGWGRPGDLPLAIDVEVTDLHGASATRRYVQQAVKRYHELTGHWPLLYTFPSFATSVGFGSWIAKRCPLWLADLGAVDRAPAKWRTVTIRQFSFEGGKHGVAGHVDLDTAAKLPVIPADKPVRPVPVKPPTRRQKLVHSLRARRARYLDTRTDAALRKYLFAKARLGIWDKRYCLHFGVDPNVSPDCQRFITRGFSMGLVATSTTGGQHAPGSFHKQRDSKGRGRGADVGVRRDLIGTATALARLQKHQAHEFKLSAKTRPIELLGPANDLCILRGRHVVLPEGSALENQHDNHNHFGK